VAKPGDRWRVFERQRAHGVRKHVDEGIRRWKAPWTGKASCIDVHGVAAVLASRVLALFERGGAPRGVTKGVRDRLPALRVVENAAARWCCLRATSGRLRVQRRRLVGKQVEVEHAPSSARPPGAGSPKGGLALPSSTCFGVFLGAVGGERSSWRKLRARESSGPRVLVSFVGCRGR